MSMPHGQIETKNGDVHLRLDAKLTQKLYGWVGQLQQDTGLPVEMEHAAIAFMCAIRDEANQSTKRQSECPEDSLYARIKEHLPKAFELVKKHGPQAFKLSQGKRRER